MAKALVKELLQQLDRGDWNRFELYAFFRHYMDELQAGADPHDATPWKSLLLALPKLDPTRGPLKISIGVSKS